MPITRDTPDTLFRAMRLAIGQLPDKQQESASILVDLLRAVLDYRGEFFCDLQLFDSSVATFLASARTADKVGLYTTWMRIACRDAALNMYHFGIALEELRQRYGEVTSWRNKDIAKVLRAVNNEFQKTFPASKYVRHAVGHAVELFSTAEKRKVNAVKGYGMYFYNVVGNTFSMTINGKVETLELSKATYCKLHEYMVRIFDAFEPIASAAVDSQSRPN